jgi:hypothetical protein
MLDDPHPDCPGVGHIVPRSHQKTFPFFAVLPDILPSYHCCSRTLSVLVLLPAESLLR